jgi:hypothetical protein
VHRRAVAMAARSGQGGHRVPGPHRRDDKRGIGSGPNRVAGRRVRVVHDGQGTVDPCRPAGCGRTAQGELDRRRLVGCRALRPYPAEQRRRPAAAQLSNSSCAGAARISSWRNRPGRLCDGGLHRHRTMRLAATDGRSTGGPARHETAPGLVRRSARSTRDGVVPGRVSRCARRVDQHHRGLGAPGARRQQATGRRRDHRAGARLGDRAQ